MKITAIYIRTSTNKQQNGHQAQKLALLEYCQTNNITKFEIYEDFGYSGSYSSRPSLNKLLLDAKKNKLSRIIVYSFSRFARSTSQLLLSLEEFEKLNIRFQSISENIDFSTPIGKAMFVIISAIAALEKDILIERTINGLNNAKSKGVKLGRPKRRNSKLIKELFHKNYSQREIAKLLNISKTTVYRELLTSGTK